MDVEGRGVQAGDPTASFFFTSIFILFVNKVPLFPSSSLNLLNMRGNIQEKLGN